MITVMQQDSCGGDSGSPVLGCYGGEDWLLGVLVKGTELPSVGPACGATGRSACIRASFADGRAECAELQACGVYQSVSLQRVHPVSD